jgi:hypothetical protein
MLKELQAVLEGRKFRYPPAVVRAIVNELLAVTDPVQPTMKVDVIKVDPADNRILECALETCQPTWAMRLTHQGQKKRPSAFDVTH